MEHIVREMIKADRPGFAQVLDESPAGDRLEVLKRLEPSEVASYIREASPHAISNLFYKLENKESIVRALPFDTLLALVRVLEGEAREAFLELLDPSDLKEITRLIRYPAKCAGSLMSPQFYYMTKDVRVDSVKSHIKSNRIPNFYSVFVHDASKKLLGRVKLNELLLAEEGQQLEHLYTETPFIGEMDSEEEVAEAIEESAVISLPVVDADGVMIGVIHQEKIIETIQSDTAGDLQKMVGSNPEESALSPYHLSVKKRLPWLVINLGTTFLAAAVVGVFEGTISQYTALAVLLPVVAGQSGNTGAQAQAVVIRSLALKELKLFDKWRVVFKEARVGFLNGVAIAMICSILVYFWSSSFALATIIGTAMIISMSLASIAGCGIPLILTARDKDPATSSSIILTTVTDIVGFVSFLGLATLFGRYLVVG